MKCLLLLIICLMPLVRLQGQTPLLDSLKKNVVTAASETAQLSSLVAICEQYENMPRDSIRQYLRLLSIHAAHQPLLRYKIAAAICTAHALFRWDEVDSCEAIIKKIRPLLTVKDSNTRAAYFQLSALNAGCSLVRADYRSAMAQLITILKEATIYHDSLALAINLNTLGVMAYNRDRLPDAIDRSLQGLAFCHEAPKYDKIKAALYTNLANNYAWIGGDKNDSAQYYLDKAIILSKKTQHLSFLANAYAVQANLYKWTGQPAKAVQYMQLTLSIRKKTEGVLSGFSNLQLALGNLYLNEKMYLKALDVFKAPVDSMLGLIRRGDITNSKINYELLQYFYEGMARSYKALNDPARYAASLATLVSVKDSLYKHNSAKAIAELETQYQLQQKENIIRQQHWVIVQRNYVLTGVLLVVFLGAFIVYLLFRDSRRRQKYRLQQIQEQEQRQAAVAVLDAAEKERKRIATDLHDNLGVYAASIASNVSQLSQHVPFAHEHLLQQLKNNSHNMILELNDTIWILKKERLRLTAISDRIKTFLLRLSTSHPHIDMEVQEDIMTDVELPAAHAFHLFQIVKEAITNTIKHSGADQLVIVIRSENDWEMIITDNGCGSLLTDNLQTDGNGLRHIRSRASICGWYIHWQNTKGTRIHISPTPNCVFFVTE
ncbi:hypothetical protein KTO58_13795 [Chitinophaga pendula]|uniref:sensor histidine kinase n=1 Tax=Chitinophaga TaxID=79328 RepID=UPI0018DFD528|nr:MULTISPECIES: hypothetical protein [Chitinophaga]UCJ04778.1 hypothetical protein KTO58_13795 [Chitinophaga pendula]